MSQVVENRSVVVLVPLTPLEPGPGPGWCTCRVRLDEAAPVEGYPNLLGVTVPRELDALVPDAAADQVVPDQPVTALASLVGPGRLRVAEVSREWPGEWGRPEG